VALTCSIQGPVPVPTCNLTPSSVLPGTTAQLSVSTSASQASALAVHLNGLMDDLGGALLLPMLSGCVFLGRLNKQRRARVCFLLIVAAAVFLISCGGSSNPAPPRTQTYTITMTGRAGVLQHTAKVSLTVQ